MSTARELASQFSSSSLPKAKVKAFATHVSQVEADSGIKMKNPLINGIPPFDYIPAVEFEVPKQQLGRVIDRLLGNGQISPNILINGIPALDHYNIKVMAGR